MGGLGECVYWVGFFYWRREKYFSRWDRWGAGRAKKIHRLLSSRRWGRRGLWGNCFDFREGLEIVKDQSLRREWSLGGYEAWRLGNLGVLMLNRELDSVGVLVGLGSWGGGWFCEYVFVAKALRVWIHMGLTINYKWIKYGLYIIL